MSTTETLTDALPKEIERVGLLIPLYESIGPASAFAVACMKGDIREAHRAMMAGDTVAMLRVYQSLRETSA
jgi:hypothetical protein